MQFCFLVAQFNIAKIKAAQNRTFLFHMRKLNWNRMKMNCFFQYLTLFFSPNLKVRDAFTKSRVWNFLKRNMKKKMAWMLYLSFNSNNFHPFRLWIIKFMFYSYENDSVALEQWANRRDQLSFGSNWCCIEKCANANERMREKKWRI